MIRALLPFAAVIGGCGVLLGLAVAAPLLLRRIDAFNVRRVEVVGGHHLVPQDAVTASGITMRSNVFDDPAPWRAALLEHPLILDARIERQVPSTVVLHVVEVVPVAFARTPELRPIDARGRVLPANPAYDGMDLPVLAVDTRVAANGFAADEATRRIAAFIAHVMRTESGLIGWISEVDVYGDAIRLVLRSEPDTEVLLPALPGAPRLRELHLTLADLATPHAAAQGDPRVMRSELSRVRRIDVRYNDQIVVALQERKS
jgi:cell division septal protein FtsQ